MKIQYMSDLHMEFEANSRWLKHEEFPVTGDILIMAGDIFYLNNKTLPLRKFWKWASENYRQVLIVPGNHEYYHGCDIMERGLEWKWMLKDNVGYYQNQVVNIDDTDIILSTMWSYIPQEYEYCVGMGLNDFYQTKYNGKTLKTSEYNSLHKHCMEFIKYSVETSTAEHIVVVTHHLPTTKVVAAHHLGSDINNAFATEYGNYIASSRIDAWIYGHSHTNIDTVIGNTRIVSNQLGYIFANEHYRNGFDATKFIEI